jgi:hypothetical protein
MRKKTPLAANAVVTLYDFQMFVHKFHVMTRFTRYDLLTAKKVNKSPDWSRIKFPRLKSIHFITGLLDA